MIIQEIEQSFLPLRLKSGGVNQMAENFLHDQILFCRHGCTKHMRSSLTGNVNEIVFFT